VAHNELCRQAGSNGRRCPVAADQAGDKTLCEVGTADLHLHDVVAGVEEALRLVSQVALALPWRVVATRGVDEDGLIGVAIAVVIGDPPESGTTATLTARSCNAMSTTPTATERSP
jgi:hypothetical protein